MAKSDYIMWVDADDIVDERSQKFLNEFKKEEISEEGTKTILAGG